MPVPGPTALQAEQYVCLKPSTFYTQVQSWPEQLISYKTKEYMVDLDGLYSMKKLIDNILTQVSTFFKVSDIEEMLMVWCRTQRPVSFF